METRYFRENDGWKASTQIPIADTPRVLTIRTGRRTNGGLVTTGSVATRDANGLMTHVLTFGAAGGDYSKTLAHSLPGRVSESTIRKQHEMVLEQIDQTLDDVAAFYAAKAQRSDGFEPETD